MYIVIHNAVTTVWLGCEVEACHFHLGQSWWLKIGSLGLNKQNGSKNSVLRKFLKKIFGLSLLSPAEVSGCFTLTLYAVFRTTGWWNSLATTVQNIALMQTPDFLRLFGSTVVHHHLGLQTHVNHSTPISVQSQ